MAEPRPSTRAIPRFNGQRNVSETFPAIRQTILNEFGAEAQWNAFKTIEGIDFPVEGADGHATGVFWIPSSINPKERTRSFSKIGHYDEGAKGRENFHLLPGHRVTQLLLEDNGPDSVAAKGVIITPRDGDWPEDGPEEPVTAKAKREIILSAGSIHTPQVLQRSGIGPKDVLEEAGVKVKVELPGVGWNLQDHSHYSVAFTCKLARISP